MLFDFQKWYLTFRLQYGSPNPNHRQNIQYKGMERSNVNNMNEFIF